MTLGGLAIVFSFMAAVLLLALVVVLAAAWSSLERRRGGADRLGRLLATGMTRVEHLLARGRRALQDGGERLAPLLARGLEGAAHRTQALADRLGARARPGGGAPARPADDEGGARGGAGAGRDGADGTGAEVPSGRRAGRDAVAAGRARGVASKGRPGAVTSPSPSPDDAAGEPSPDADRLPTSFRDRLAG